MLKYNELDLVYLTFNDGRALYIAETISEIIILKKLRSKTTFITRPATPGGQGGHDPPTFLHKKKKGNKKRKERVSKQKLLKGYHQGKNVTVLAILERLEFKNFSFQPTIVADNTFQCSMVPPH